MAMSMQAQLSIFKYLVLQKIRRVPRYPIVVMVEPLFACNLECAGCGKIQYPTEILRKRLSPQEVFESVDECGAPVVSIAGGEPLMHPEIGRIVEGLIARRKVVYLCTNALLLEKKIDRFRPSPYLVLSIHLDGVEKTHDRMVCREGVYKTAMSAIRLAKSKGFTVMTNSTIFQGEDPEEFRRFFDDNMVNGVDGMMISPGYAYEKAPRQDVFLQRAQTKTWFREALRDWRQKGWSFNHSPFYLDFLEGKRDYDCTPWGNPLRNVFGWQRPCYLMSEGGYAKTYKELLETTDWSNYGHASGNPKCANCMTHCGFEPTAMADGLSSPSKFVQLVADFASIKAPKKVPGAVGARAAQEEAAGVDP